MDLAESEPDKAHAVNHHAVKNIAKISKKYNIKLIHISTDYVFDGCGIRAYREFDTTNPQSVYGQSKLDGELAIESIKPKNTLILRTSWLYSDTEKFC